MDIPDSKVNAPLASVGKLLGTGHRVVLDEGGSYVMTEKTKQVMKVRREKGVFGWDVWMAQDTDGDMVMGDADGEANNSKLGFSRPG